MFERARLETELEPGETVVWSGKPYDGVLFRPFDAIIIPAFIAWGGIPSYVLFTGAGGRSGDVLFVLPFVLIGFYMLVGRFAVDIVRRRRTRYVLTNRSATIVAGFGSRVTRVALDRVAEISFQRSAGGRGTITFGRKTSPFEYSAQGTYLGTGPAVPTFEAIDGGGSVYARVRSLTNAAAEFSPRAAPES